MDLLILVLIACLVGFGVWLLTTKIPMPPIWANVIQVAALIMLILWLLSRLGASIPNIL